MDNEYYTTQLKFTLQDSFASYDFAHYDSDPYPDPPDDSSGETNSHGTSCAGEIAMVKNSQCGVGVAYKSKVASKLNNLQNRICLVAL